MKQEGSSRRSFVLAALAVAFFGLPTPSEAKQKRKRSRRPRGMNINYPRGTTDDGACPCNGGKVCVGPRGGRYCITSSGWKRYGV